MDNAAKDNGRLNLNKVAVLLVDANQNSLDVVGQILSGLGVRTMRKCQSADEALKLAATLPFEFIVADCSLGSMDGFKFTRTIRGGLEGPNACTPIILMSTQSRKTNVHRARDSGANFFVTKPVTPKVLLDRIMWVATDERPFIQCETYCGHDRRFKREGPPFGMEGRRREDKNTTLGDAVMPNLSQDEINDFMKPMKVKL